MRSWAARASPPGQPEWIAETATVRVLSRCTDQADVVIPQTPNEGVAFAGGDIVVDRRVPFMDRARGNVPWYGLAHTFRERSTSGTLPCAPTDALYRPALCGRRGI